MEHWHVVRCTTGRKYNVRISRGEYIDRVIYGMALTVIPACAAAMVLVFLALIG